MAADGGATVWERAGAAAGGRQAAALARAYSATLVAFFVMGLVVLVMGVMIGMIARSQAGQRPGQFIVVMIAHSLPRTIRLSCTACHRTPINFMLQGTTTIAVVQRKDYSGLRGRAKGHFRFVRRSTAGRFYPGEAQACRSAAKGIAANIRGVAGGRLTARVAAGAGLCRTRGWVCSGAHCRTDDRRTGSDEPGEPPLLVVVFGAVHTPMPNRAGRPRFRIAPGNCPAAIRRLPVDLADRLRAGTRSYSRSTSAFIARNMQWRWKLPLIQAAWPNVEILPIEVPLIEQAVQIGRETAQSVLSTWRRIASFWPAAISLTMARNVSLHTGGNRA